MRPKRYPYQGKKSFDHRNSQSLEKRLFRNFTKADNFY